MLLCLRVRTSVVLCRTVSGWGIVFTFSFFFLVLLGSQLHFSDILFVSTYLCTLCHSCLMGNTFADIAARKDNVK